MRDSNKAAKELGYDPESNDKKKVILYIIFGIVVVAILAIITTSAYIMIKNNNNDENSKKEVEEEYVSEPKKQAEIKPSNPLNVEVDSPFNKEVVKQGSRLREGNYDIVGSLRIPKTGINYKIYAPVDTASLEKGLAMLTSTNGVNNPGNTVIWGHNYQSDKFFGKNHTLKNGDKVYVKDLNGEEIEYTIYHGEYVKPNYRDYITRDVQGRTELSLSTCSDTAQERYLLFAKRTNEQANNQGANNQVNQVNQITLQSPQTNRRN